MTPCSIIRFERDSRTKWLWIYNKEENISIIQIESKELFYIHPNKTKGFLVKNGSYYDLIIPDKHGYRNTIEAIDRKTLTSKQRERFKKYLNEIVELI